MSPFQYVRELVVYLRGLPGASGYGSTTTAEQVTEGLDLQAYTAIVTGATSGIGQEAARVLAKRGARVVLAVRNAEKAQKVMSLILEETPSARLEFFHLNLASLKSVRVFAAEFLSRDLPLNILVNNAGLLLKKFDLTEDGLERTFATNHLGHFLLTNLLLERMKETADKSGIEGRIVVVGSEATRLAYRDAIQFDRLHDAKSYWSVPAYGQSKLCNVLHTKELANRLQAERANVTANVLHPGCIDTNFGKGEFPFSFNKYVEELCFWVSSSFLKSIPQAAATPCYVATNAGLKGITGEYFTDCNISPPATRKSIDMELAARLWKYSEELTASSRSANELGGHVESLSSGNL
ncbi:unnamed protein product [Sphagnum troendelagicum]